VRSFLGRRSSSGSAVQLDPAQTRRTHFAYLDGIRGIMALFIVVGHAYWTTWPLELGKQPSAELRPWLNIFLYARPIPIFIVLSGFCLTLAVLRDGGVLRGGGIGFFLGRARRIIPAFYAGLLLSLVLIWTVIGGETGTHWDIGIPVGWDGYVGNLLLVQNLVGEGQINGAYWSIGAEVQCYLFFPLLVLVWRLAGIVASTALGLGIGFAGIFFVDRLHEHGFAFPVATPIFVGLFALGMLGAVLAFSEQHAVVRLRERVPWMLLALAILFAVVALDIRWGFLEMLRHGAYIDLMIGLASVALFIGASRARPSRLRSFLQLRPLAVLGAISYSLYLVHRPLLQVEWQYAVDPFGFGDVTAFLLATFGTAAIVLLTYPFHLAFEKPFMSSRQRRAAEGEFVQTGRSASRREPSPSDVAGRLHAAGRASTAPGTDS
jgi:peptidoglycan/LPS O-acetylase OafA/YrhL